MSQIAPVLGRTFKAKLTRKNEHVPIVNSFRAEAENHPYVLKTRERIGLAFRPIDLFEKFGEGVFGYFYLMKRLPLILGGFLVILMPILYVNSTPRYSEHSIEQELRGKLLGIFSISNLKNLEVALICRCPPATSDKAAP